MISRLRALTSRFGVLLGCCLGASSFGACSEDKPLTQIVVIVDSDFSGLTRIEADIRGFEERETVTAELEDAPLPRRFSLVHDGGELGPMSVTLRAYADDDDEPLLVEPRTDMFFVPGKTLLLKIDLLAACIGLCDEGEACVDPGECVSSRDAAELIPWTGPPDGLTVGGPFDAGMDSGMGSPDGAVEDADVRDADHDAANPDPDSTTPDADDADGSDEGPPDGAEDTGTPDPVWSFEPGNVDLDDSDIVDLDRHDVVLDCGLVEINSTDVTASGFCDDPPPEMTVVDLPADGGEALVVVMSSLQIALDSTLRLRGERPVILLVEGDVSIAGTLDASAEGSVAGPGAGRGCELSTGTVGNSNGSGGGDGASGGGGGGFVSAGAAGGASNNTDSVPGGAAVVAPSLVPLRGGCSGGAGGVDVSGSAGLGGGGGGALQLSVAGTLTLTGSIRAAGGGGSPGSGVQAGGGGGGSGGAVALEAETLVIDPLAVIAVNGGAGAGGQPTTSGTGDLISTAGADGTASATLATPGVGNGSGGDGGAGSALVAPAESGDDGVGYGTFCPAICSYGGGGGGAGGVGRIELRGASSCAPEGVFSPAPAVECEECGACPAPPEPWCVARTQTTQLYAICSGVQTWANARAACQGADMDLVKITDQPENDYLVSQIPASTWYWIGAANIGSDDWRWVIGNSPFWLGDDQGAAVGTAFANWRSGDPQGNGPCGRLRDDGWADQSCDMTYGYICEQ